MSEAMKPNGIGSSTGSRMQGRPERSSFSAARQSESRSPADAGTRIGVAAISSARSSVASERLSTKSAPALLGIRRVDAHEEPSGMQRCYSLLKMAERRRRQTAEVDHVRPLPCISAGLRHDLLDRELRRVHDLRENAHAVARKVDSRSRLAKVLGNVVEIVGSARDRHAPVRRKRVEVPGAETRHEDAIRMDFLARQATAHDVGGHQRRHLDAYVTNVPAELGLHLREHAPEPGLREVTGQEEDPLRHARRALTASTSPLRDSTTAVRSNSLSFSTFSRSIRRGHTFTMPPGDLVSSSGAVSQANTMTGTRHLPACANTLVASVSEMPCTNFATVLEVAGATTRV